ncbi:Domain of unknown function DUF4524 [Plasmopara halstedii]|uniref:C5orf34-like C-terminal domain-containing protein n=1 Tax=Plasmopara halstedii TaxID=4781 RepID=A0A0P1B1R5_PLAHL|nr:Domain of unknown function DUF4524 [Plasmopara halstedii]CEG47684.1 Domain of unknown function DUF4524 [Plasmopara halstedii]|eukprot:XP_024584053.1 Domain of unknown function DUF4524 [Plasmopara halstedii]
MQGAKRRRCVLLMDGSAIGCFQRNALETHIIVLEASGHTYSYIHPDGTRTRHLTPTALSSHRPFVLDTLNFRNRLSLHAPYVCLQLMDTSTVRRQHRVRAPRATWPCFEGKTNVSKLYNDQKKCLEIHSIDGSAKVQLHLSGKLVDIFCVLEVKMSDEDLDESSSYAYYTTIHQSFAVNETPESFQFPVKFLLAAKDAWDQDRNAEMEYDDKSISVSQWPRNGAFAARPSFPVIATRLNDTECNESRSDCLPLVEILRVATKPSKYMYKRVVAEILGDNTMVFIDRRMYNLQPEVVVQFDCKSSLLTACGGFFTLYDDRGQSRHRFTRETIPPPTTVSYSCLSGSITSLCQHIDYVLQAFKDTARMHNLSALSSAFTQSDEIEIIEEAKNELGRFRAFRDGRIRVAFADRTILQIDPHGEKCSFLFSDGTSGQTTLASAPLRHRYYIYEALDFGDWAFSSKEERILSHERRQKAQAITSHELQRIHVRCEMNSKVNMSVQTLSTDKKETRAPCSFDLSIHGEVQKIQAATQAHIASVNMSLQAAFVAAKIDTEGHQTGLNDAKFDQMELSIS